MSQVTNSASIFKDRSQTTQIIYQTLIQAIARNQPDTSRGISAADAELLHALAVAASTLTSFNEAERRTAWETISHTAALAMGLLNEAVSPAVNDRPIPISQNE